jgi:hypothetical protein
MNSKTDIDRYKGSTLEFPISSEILIRKFYILLPETLTAVQHVAPIGCIAD